MAKAKNGGIGHNSSDARLKSFVERIERLEDEKKALGADVREVYAEAKSVGFDAPTIRKIIKIRRMDAGDRAEQEALLEVYMNALGMLADTPLGKAAADRALHS